MRFCYGRTEKGKLIRLAKIYSKNEHKIDKKNISSDIIRIIDTLKSYGYTAYIVGGAIRDLLAGKLPKDFDIVTDAHPREVKKCFRGAQIIGKRFPIVLVRNKKQDFVEISTFRSDLEDENDNLANSIKATSSKYKKSTHKKRTIQAAIENTEFGSIEQDVKRRDFTCNALYYDISREIVLDFVDGLIDIQAKKLKAVRTSFDEDPIRMLRAFKYANKIGLKIDNPLKKEISKHIKLLAKVPASRISDEMMKILVSGASAYIIQDIFAHKLLLYMLPDLYKWYNSRKVPKEQLFKHLVTADQKVAEKYSRIRGLEMLLKEFVKEIITQENWGKSKQKKEEERSTKNSNKKNEKRITQNDIFKIVSEAKKIIQPMTPPNAEIHNAVISVLISEELLLPQYFAKRSKLTSNRNRKS